MEKILCAAIHFDNGVKHVHQPINITTGIVVTGYRHSVCFGILSALGINRKIFDSKETQGFLTSGNRFVNRIEAWKIAEAANQIIENKNRFWKGNLYSEDLY